MSIGATAATRAVLGFPDVTLQPGQQRASLVVAMLASATRKALLAMPEAGSAQAARFDPARESCKRVLAACGEKGLDALSESELNQKCEQLRASCAQALECFCRQLKDTPSNTSMQRACSSLTSALLFSGMGKCPPGAAAPT